MILDNYKILVVVDFDHIHHNDEGQCNENSLDSIVYKIERYVQINSMKDIVAEELFVSPFLLENTCNRFVILILQMYLDS